MSKKLMGLVACSVLVVATAQGADLTPAPSAPAVSWTGVYLGAELGGRLGSANWTAASLQDAAGIDIVQGGALPNKAIDASAQAKYEPGSPRVGGYIGYNFQFAPQWVGGVEFDLAYADKRETAHGLPGCAVSCAPGFPGGIASPSADFSSVAFRWDASSRVRLGYLVTPGLLLYGTGGIAFQNITISGACQHSDSDPFCSTAPGNPLSVISRATTRTGWTAGGGFEALMSGNWLLRGEYRFSDFNVWKDSFSFGLPGGPNVGYDTYRYQLKIATQIATLGLAYKF